MTISLAVLVLTIAGLQRIMHSSPAAAAGGIIPTPETDPENHAGHFTPFTTAETGDITRLANPYTNIPTRLDVITYTVEAGDTPTGIAAKFNLRPESILWGNPTLDTDASSLRLGQVLKILPLVAILLAASARPTFNRLAHWNLHHKEWVRLALGGGAVAMGLIILATV